MDTASRQVRVWVIGLGMVGRWLLRALHSQSDRLATRHGASVVVVGVANARDGFIYDQSGLDVPAVLGLIGHGRSIAELPGARRWSSSHEGLRATDADILVEVTGSRSDDGQPGLSHMREALGRGIPVVTSNKWPVALHGVELAELARSRSAVLRAESTVMSGTPVLGPLVDGLAGTIPIRLRGVLNATANFVLSRMADGSSYEGALAEAQRSGLAERDPTADVEGHDTVAKLMILAGLVFGRQLRRHEVACRGITDIAPTEVDPAGKSGGRLRHIGTLEFSEADGLGEVSARVEPLLVGHDDLLAKIEGTTNAVTLRTDPVGDTTIIGPGAGRELAGQGVLSDLIGLARWRLTS